MITGHTIYQNNEWTCLKNKEVEPVEAAQMKSYQSNAYKKSLSWLHFDDEPRIKDRQQVKDQQSCIFIFEVYLTFLIAARSTSNSTIVFHIRPYDRFIEIQSNLKRKKLQRTNQGSNFLGCSFSKNVRAPIQFRREKQPQHFTG